MSAKRPLAGATGTEIAAHFAHELPEPDFRLADWAKPDQDLLKSVFFTASLTIMRTPIHRAFVFSATVFLLLLVADAAAWGGYQGLTPEGQEGSLILIHATVLGAALVSTFLGSLVAFSLRRNQIPSAQSTAYLALAFAVVSFYAVVASFTAAGVVGMLAWLVIGAALFAALGTLRSQHNG